MIAICLLTCGRVDLTERTVSSFAKFNAGRTDLKLLHADAGGEGPDQASSCAIAKAAGFRTVRAPKEREGQIESFRKLMAAVGRAKAEYMLWLENDWESTHPIPTLRFLGSQPTIDQWKLYGAAKMRAGGPRKLAGTKRLGSDDAIVWRESMLKGWEVADCSHWAAGGTIIRPEKLKPFLGLDRLKDVIVAANELRTMRPTKNLLWHIGHETTAGFLG